MLKTVVLPKQRDKGKHSIVRQGDPAQQQAISRQLAAQEDFLRASSSPCIIQPSCVCQWDGVSHEGFVPQPTGRVLSSMGRFSRGRKLISLEEILYLSEANAITVSCPSDEADSSSRRNLTRTEVFRKVLEAGLSLNVYTVYAHLKRLGFVLHRHFDRPERHNSDLSSTDTDRPLALTPAVESKTDGCVPNKDSKSENPIYRKWWSNPFGPIPEQYRNVRVRVVSSESLITLSSQLVPMPGESFTSIAKQNPDILVCYDVVRPGRRQNSGTEMYVIVAAAIPAPRVLHALERCARGRQVRIACSTDSGGLVFYSSQAYIAFA